EALKEAVLRLLLEPWWWWWLNHLGCARHHRHRLASTFGHLWFAVMVVVVCHWGKLIRGGGAARAVKVHSSGRGGLLRTGELQLEPLQPAQLGAQPLEPLGVGGQVANGDLHLQAFQPSAVS